MADELRSVREVAVWTNIKVLYKNNTPKPTKLNGSDSTIFKVLSIMLKFAGPTETFTPKRKRTLLQIF